VRSAGDEDPRADGRKPGNVIGHLSDVIAVAHPSACVEKGHPR